MKLIMFQQFPLMFSVISSLELPGGRNPPAVPASVVVVPSLRCRLCSYVVACEVQQMTWLGWAKVRIFSVTEKQGGQLRSSVPLRIFGFVFQLLCLLIDQVEQQKTSWLYYPSWWAGQSKAENRSSAYRGPPLRLPKAAWTNCSVLRWFDTICSVAHLTEKSSLLPESRLKNIWIV